MYSLPLSYRYTSLSAYTSQSTPENSLGGFISTNSIYTETTLSSSVSQSATIIPVTTVPSISIGLSQVDIEVVEYTGINSTDSQLTGVTRGKVPACAFPHGLNPNAGIVRYLSINNLFDPKFDDIYQQYRCIAIKNISSISVEDVKIILVPDVNSDVDIDVGIEVPSHDYRTSTITTATSNIVLVASSLAGLFANNYFSGSALRMTSGIALGSNSTISSYDGTTGTFVLASTIASVAVGDTFEIEAAPSQTVINQLIKPISNNQLFFGFLNEGGSNEISYGNIRENSNTLQPNDVFYLWIQRTLQRNMKSKPDTATIVLVSYMEAGS